MMRMRIFRLIDIEKANELLKYKFKNIIDAQKYINIYIIIDIFVEYR